MMLGGMKEIENDAQKSGFLWKWNAADSGNGNRIRNGYISRSYNIKFTNIYSRWGKYRIFKCTIYGYICGVCNRASSSGYVYLLELLWTANDNNAYTNRWTWIHDGYDDVCTYNGEKNKFKRKTFNTGSIKSERFIWYSKTY